MECSKATGQSLYHPPLASAGTLNPEAAKARRRKGHTPPTCGTARLQGRNALIPWRLARGPHLEQPLEQGHGAGGHMQVEVAQETAAQEGELPVQRGAAGQRDG